VARGRRLVTAVERLLIALSLTPCSADTGENTMTDGATLKVLGVAAPDALVLETRLPTVVSPLESAIGLFEYRSERHTIDRSRALLLPQGVKVRVRAHTSALSFAAIGFADAVIDRAVRLNGRLGVTRERFDRWLAVPAVVPRTVWVHEVIHRYVFERHALEEAASEAARFLEVELAKEIYFLLRDRERGAERASIQRELSEPVRRAVAHIEQHLFGWTAVAELSRVSGASESSLLRAFRREVGESPAAYWRARKLEEALHLLSSGSHSVAEVSERVGYENAAAFGEAFRRRFGRPPSTFKPREVIRRAPS
jgi:AraC-like DNA-binding protein